MALDDWFKPPTQADLAPATPALAPQVAMRDIGDAAAIRQAIFDKSLHAAANMPPIANATHSLRLTNVGYTDAKKPVAYSPADQTQAVLEGRTLGRKLQGTWELSDVATGNVLSRKRAALADVPWLHDDGTFVIRGNSYSLGNQLRQDAGVFARERGDGALESHFNVLPGHGLAHRVILEPETGIFRMRVGQAMLPLYSVLRGMGVSHEDLHNTWGRALADANRAKDDPKAIDKMYAKLFRTPEVGIDHAGKTKAVAEKMLAMKLDPFVTEHTLGEAHETIQPRTYLLATKKLLDISHGKAKVDDRDSPAYQTLHGPEDLISERFGKDRAGLRKLLWRAALTKNVNHIPSYFFQKGVASAIQSSGVGTTSESINPSMLLDQLHRVTKLGEGGISGGVDAIPDEARSVQAGQTGFIDLVTTAESESVGIDGRIASRVKKGDDNRMYAPFIDVKTGEEVYKSPRDLLKAAVAPPGEMQSGRRWIKVLKNNRMTYAKPSEVDYVLSDMEGTFAPLDNLVPMKSAMKGQRSAMAQRMTGQALALVTPEAPFVRTGAPDGDSYERKLSKYMGAVHAEGDGTVRNVTEHAIEVAHDDGTTKTHPIQKFLPFNRKSGFRQTPMVQQGQRIQKGQLLAKSNYTDDEGTTALGANLRTAWMPWMGYGYEDANVVSESAAKKLTSEHVYQHAFEPEDGLTRSRKAFIALYPSKWSKQTLAAFDDTGLPKVGTILKHGDPIWLAVRERQDTGRRLHGGKSSSWSDASEVWDHDTDGEVVAVANTPKGANVVVRTLAPLKVGDKLAGRHGNKGVVAEIVPDHQMPHDADGKPYEVMFNPLGTISRGNPAAALETWLGKIVEKTGRKPYNIADFGSIPDLHDYVGKEMQRAGVTPHEHLYDPLRGGAVIPDVMTGNTFWMKLHHTADSKIQGRGVGAYTSEGRPAKGGFEGAKKVSLLNTNALLSHGALSNIRDAVLYRGQAHPDFWRRFLSGHSDIDVANPQIHHKFIATLQAAGINPSRIGSKMRLLALTNKDVDQLAEGRELENGETLDWGKKMAPIPGGLFDPKLGTDGSKWSSIKLAEPLLNPIMEEPARKILGLTEAKFRDVLAGRESFAGRTGPEAIATALKNIDVPKEMAAARAIIASGRKTYRDLAQKKLGYLKGCHDNDLHPGDWVLDRVPVLPPKFRPVSLMQKTKIPLVADANLLYRDLFETNQHWKSFKDQIDDVGDERLATYDALKAVVGLGDPVQPKTLEKNAKGMLRILFGSSPKHGYVQSKLIGSSTDLVGRAVVVPDPKLNMDEIGLPETSAWTMYRPFVIRELVRNGMDRVRAIREVADQTPLARKTLISVTEKRPIVADRAPVLHRYSVMAFKPKLTSGDVLRMPVQITAGMGMDFDGDQQIGHVIVAVSDNVASGDSSPILGKSLIQLKGTAMSYHELTLPVAEGCRTYFCDLANFPRGKRIKTTQGAKGPIDWYEVPDGVFILSHNADGPAWQKPTLWSVHHDRLVELVELQSGRQIITDDDPRAVYGCGIDSLTPSRFTPLSAVNQSVVVPRLRNLTDLPAVEELQAISTADYASKVSNVDVSRLPATIELTREFGYFLGVAVGNGWVTGNQTCVASSNAAVRAAVDSSVTSIFEAGKRRPAGGITHREKPTDVNLGYGASTRVAYSSVELSKLVVPATGRGADNKHLPEFFLNGPREFREGLLGGLMDTDGSIGVAKPKATKPKPQLMLSYSSNSLRLVREIHLLLLTFGVRSRISPTKTPAGKLAWHLSISSVDAVDVDVKAMLLANMHHDIKREKLQNAPAVRTDGPNARNDLVPLPRKLALAITGEMHTPKDRTKWPDGQQTLYSSLHDARTRNYVTRNVAKLVPAFLKSGSKLVNDPDWLAWRKIVDDETVTWDPVVDRKVTGIRETGYDLTVPGYETFTNADGVVLSNTAQFHVPLSDAAAEEAMQKMLPSKNLFAVSNFRAHQLPSKEFLVGLYQASTLKNANRRAQVFRRLEDVEAAFARGELSAGDPIEILR